MEPMTIFNEIPKQEGRGKRWYIWHYLMRFLNKKDVDKTNMEPMTLFNEISKQEGRGKTCNLWQYLMRFLNKKDVENM